MDPHHMFIMSSLAVVGFTTQASELQEPVTIPSYTLPKESSSTSSVSEVPADLQEEPNRSCCFAFSSRSVSRSHRLRHQIYPVDVIPSDKTSLELARLLKEITRLQLAQCTLTLVYDEPMADSIALQTMMALPNSKQMVMVGSEADFDVVVWKANGCRGYFYLLHQPKAFLVFTNTSEDPWDFNGYHVLLGGSQDDIQAFATSRKGKKTEHIIGLVPDATTARGESWGVYMNRLYWTHPLQRINTWVDGAFVAPLSLFPDKLANLNGVTLTVITFEWEPSVLYRNDEDEARRQLYGIDIEVVKAIALALNFSVAYQEPPPGEFWGSQQEDELWNGMVGLLSRNEADIGIVNLFLTLGRYGVVDYSAPYDAEVSCFLTRAAAPSPRWLSLALPFQQQTWLALALGLAICGIALFVFARASGREVAPFRSLQQCLLMTFAAHAREPSILQPRMHATKVFISFLWLYTIILTTAYSSNLTAFLTVSREPQPMDTIKELHDARMEVNSIGDFFRGSLSSAVDPYLQGLAERFVSYTSLEDLFPVVQEGKAAYLHNRQFLEFAIATRFTERTGTASMRIMKECFAPYNIAMALQRHSPIKAKFDKVIRWLLASGLVRRWFLESLRLSRKIEAKGVAVAEEQEKGKSEGPPNKDTSSTGVIPLSIDHLQGVFLILVLSYVFSFLILLLEMRARGTSLGGDTLEESLKAS